MRPKLTHAAVPMKLERLCGGGPTKWSRPGADPMRSSQANDDGLTRG